MSSFTGSLITRHENGELFVVTPFEFHVAAPESNLFVRVESGFQTDLVTVPWYAQWAAPKIGKYDRSSVVHDRLYKNPVLLSRTPDTVVETKVSRMMCDYIFYQAMLVDGVGSIRAIYMWMAVRCFGWIWFDGH